MSKRYAEDIADGNQAYLKRQKIGTAAEPVAPKEGIWLGSARKLRQTLAFDQDAGRSKQGIQAFKGFLDSFSEPEADNSARLVILTEYLESQKPADEEDNTHVYLSDVLQTWSLASQSNNEGLLSAVPAVLALLLRTLSNHLELSEYGSRLGRTLLQKRQLELIVRGLKSNKTREFLISPVLRLLKELSTFDGGALARQVFRARDSVFQNLPRNLNLRFTGDGVEDFKRPSVRTNALRFILSLVKFLPADAKRELLNQRDVVTALTKDIKDDPPFIIRDILETLKTSVLQDEALPRDAKTNLVNAPFLSRVAMLYRYTQTDEEVSPTKKPIETLAHEFLLISCTSPLIGVLNRQAGFYPRGIDPDDTHDADLEQSFIDLGIDSIEWMDRYTDKVPVRNTILSEFIQNLRPWSSTKQSDLLLSILASAPELVAEYFYNKRTFAFDPKLTATWIGYSAFIFSAIQLPLPKYFGHQGGYARLPPPPAIVLENILPSPLTLKALRDCILPKQGHLITFFAVRLLCIAFTKLQSALRMYQEASSGPSSIWSQAADRLSDDFCERCPSIKDIISAFRRTTDSDLLQREAFTKLLVLYFEVAPRVALEAKFDVSEALSTAINALEKTELAPEERAMRSMELENLFQFAHFSPGMRWFVKMPGSSLSPFTTMLKMSAEAPADLPLLKIGSVLASDATENQILQSETAVSSLESLILSLRSLRKSDGSRAAYAFIDGCALQCNNKPINYIFNLEEIRSRLQNSTEKSSAVSLLTMAMAEQWKFLVESTVEPELRATSKFLSQHLARSMKIGEDRKVIEAVIERLVAETADNSFARTSLDEAKSLIEDIIIPAARVATPENSVVNKSNAPTEDEKSQIPVSMLEELDEIPADPSSLTKWTTREVDEVIEGGHAAALIRLLSSEHLSIRKEAATNISKFAAKLKESSFEERDQIWLLLCEVVETAKKVIDQEPLATVISAFASNAIAVLTDPLHCLYPKINKFLSQGPTWELAKIPLMYKIFDEAPSLDDAHYKEMSWLLTYMLAGLRTEADMAIYRKRRVFEKLFSIYNSPFLGVGLRERILRILFRAMTIEGGSTTLITRFSTMTWLAAQVALRGGVPLKVLMEKILESSDHDRVDKWSKKGAKGLKDDAILF